MNNIIDIPKVPINIIEAAKQGKLIVFIGAGVSRIIGGPSWQELAYRYLKSLYEKRFINYYELNYLNKLEPKKILSICKIIEKEKEIKESDIKKFLLLNKELNEKYKIYESLLNFNCIFVTTNYDDYFDKVINEYNKENNYSSNNTKQKEWSIIDSSEKILVSKLENKTLIHLHGSVKKPENIIMTIRDYMKYYYKETKITCFLEQFFKSYTVLFIGYGLEEYEIIEFIINKSTFSENNETKNNKELAHYMLYPIFKKEVNLLEYQKKYYQELGIELIPYPIDENGYEHLSNVLLEWSKQIGQISLDQNFLDRVKIIDEVI